MFKAPFSFSGRIRRMEYGFSYILYVIVAVAFMFILGENDQPLLLFLFLLPAVWFMLAQGAKRCHDLGNSGWFQIIPFYGLWMLFANSEYGTNKYGPNPKNIGVIDGLDELAKDV